MNKSKTYRRAKKVKHTRRKRGGQENTENFIFPSNQISTQSNDDAAYKEIGIIHITDSAAINALRNLGSSVANFFGSKGFDNTVFDTCRNEALKKLAEKIGANQKVCNMRMDMDMANKELVFIHIYGTLLEKQSSVTEPEEESETDKEFEQQK